MSNRKSFLAKRVVLFLFCILLLSGIGLAMRFANFNSPVKWTIDGDIFCNNRYPICLQNESHWTPVFTQHHMFKRPERLLALAKPVNDVSGENGFAHVALSSVDSAIRDGVRIVNPLTYLQMSINLMRRRSHKFEEVKPLSIEILNGKEVATGRFLSAASSKSEPVISMPYIFLNGDQVCSVVYFASSNQFEKNREDAMRIIKSFRFGSEGMKK